VKEIKDFLLPMLTHIYDKDEHVGVIERAIQVIKERCRCICHSVPYKYYTKLMIKALISVVLKWLNAFPSKGSISDTMSPSMILEEGKPNPNMNNTHISFGSYAFVHIGTDNTMKRRSIPAIALNESNEHGRHYFMNLYTGKKMHSYNWQELPIDNETIAQGEELAQEEKAKRLTDTYPMFEWAPGVPIIDELLPNVNENDDEEQNDENKNDDFENIVDQEEHIIDHDNVIDLADNDDTQFL
jgi:hypothetical protein